MYRWAVIGSGTNQRLCEFQIFIKFEREGKEHFDYLLIRFAIQF